RVWDVTKVLGEPIKYSISKDKSATYRPLETAVGLPKKDFADDFDKKDFDKKAEEKKDDKEDKKEEKKEDKKEERPPEPFDDSSSLTLKGHTSEVYSVVFSPDGKRLVSGGGEFHKPGEVKVWNAATGKEAMSLRGHTSTVTSVAFSPDGKRIVSA